MPDDLPNLTEPAPVPTLLVTGWAVGRVNSLLHLVGWATMRIRGLDEEHLVQVRVATPTEAAADLREQISFELAGGND